MIKTIKTLINKIFKKKTKKKEKTINAVDEINTAVNDNFYNNFNNLI